MTSWLESIEKRLREATPREFWIRFNNTPPYADVGKEPMRRYENNTLDIVHVQEVTITPTDVERLLKAHKIMRTCLEEIKEHHEEQCNFFEDGYEGDCDCVQKKNRDALAEVDKLGE